MIFEGPKTTNTPSRPLLRRAGLVLAAGLATVGLLSACSGSSSSNKNGAASTVASTQSPATFAPNSPAVTDSGTPASTVPTTVGDPNLPGDPLSYANKLFADWKAGDPTAAGTLATPVAINALFAQKYAESDDWSDANCSGTTEGKGSSAKSTSTCVWTSAEGKLTVKIDNANLGKGQAVTKATFSKA
jgi:hypothetical protein